ncbi:MAG: pyridoxal phosphate-dependent aminotransferase [Burkholderiaceae bacterium]
MNEAQAGRAAADSGPSERSSGAIPFTGLVASLPSAIPFVGPEALERRRQRRFRARIGANESAFGMSPAAAEAMRRAVGESAWYGDPENHDLREALAAHHRVSPDEICVDAGIDSLLGLAVRMTVTPGTPVVSSLGAYPTFNYHVAGFGGRLEAVPYRDDHEDPDALAERQRQTAAPLVYLANPDNPMGTWHPVERIAAFIDRLPGGCLLLLDEAYGEFAPPGSLAPLDTGDPRVLRLRTFSKAYGMAGARVGYAIGHRELITGLNKIRNHFGVSRMAQAGALAALGDSGFLAEVGRAVTAGRARVAAFAQRLGLCSLPSATNFVAVDLGSPTRAKAMLDALACADVFIRMPGVPPLNRCVRVGVGRDDEMTVFEHAFEAALPGLPD